MDLLPHDRISLEIYCFGAFAFFIGLFSLVFFLWRYDQHYKGKARKKRSYDPKARPLPRSLGNRPAKFRSRDGMTHIFPRIPRARPDEDTNILPRTSDNSETHFINIPDWAFLNGPRQNHG